MKKKKKPKGYDHKPADPAPPHPVWPRSKIQCLLGGQGGEGKEVGAGAASRWEKRRRKKNIEKSHTTSPQKTNLQLLQNCSQSLKEVKKFFRILF